jgi:hypothetical protein
MTTSTRYKFVKNALGVPFTVSNFPVSNDGDDRQVKQVKRVLSAIDIGVSTGKVGHPAGAIVDVIPNSSNVLFVKGLTYRPGAAVDGFIPLILMDNNTIGAAIAEINYALGTDNTIRVLDYGQGGDAALAIGDIVFVEVTLGATIDSLDSMN